MATRVLQFVSGETDYVFSPDAEKRRRADVQEKLEALTGKSIDQLRQELEMVSRSRRTRLLKGFAAVLG